MKKIIGLISIIVVISCDDIVGIDDISDNEVTIIAPSEGTVLNTLSPTFSWEILDGAETYQLQIATPSFENATQVVLDTTITSTNFSFSLDLGIYAWRIRAENSAYETPYTTQSFSIE